MVKPVLPEAWSFNMNAMALKSWKRARNGNVTSRRFLRPNVSMVLKAGRANRKLMIPTPSDHYQARQLSDLVLLSSRE